MPHATLPSPGFQALILCGPGASLDTFTSNIEAFPKALVPVANRPMVWYPIDWCSRMGITDITLVTPPAARKATQTYLDLNPHFTVLPKIKYCSPEGLSENTGTAELFRLSEVRNAIRGDFIVLPCDLICELDGLSLLEEWLVLQAGLGAARGGRTKDGTPVRGGVGGEQSGRRGGLSVWYETKVEDNIKKEETDFFISAPISKPVIAPQPGSLRGDISQLVMCMPTDALKDAQADQGGDFTLRHNSVRKFGRVRMYTTRRDAHIYLFPYWILDLIEQNEGFETLGEDVLGWWSKACWQDGLGDKLGLRKILALEQKPQTTPPDSNDENPLPDDVDLAGYITTSSASRSNLVPGKAVSLASRVVAGSTPSTTFERTLASSEKELVVPPMLVYNQPSSPSAPLIRRVDTEEQLLNISMQLAKLPALEDKSVSHHSPYAHHCKIDRQIKLPKLGHVDPKTSLIAPNVTLNERISIKESVIGAGCTIGTGAKITRCLLMDDVVVGDFVSLVGCIVGPRARITGGPKEDKRKTELKNVKVTGDFVVDWGTSVEGEVLGGGGLLDDAEFDEDGAESED